MSSIPRILVIGATGRIGTELIRLLTAENAPLRALVRQEAKAALLTQINPNIDIKIGDLRHIETIPPALQQIDKVFLLTADHPQQALMEGNFIEAAAQTAVQHIVKLSAFVAGLTPPISFGRQLSQVEQRLQASGIPWTILRPYMFMQNFLEFAPLIATRNLFMGPFGQAEVSMVDTRDVAAVAKAVLLETGHHSQIYEITGPEPLRFSQTADMLSHALGRKIRYISAPAWLAGLAMRREGVSKWEVAMRLELFRLLRANGEKQTTDVVERIGKRPPRPFVQFVQDHLAAFQTP